MARSILTGNYTAPGPTFGYHQDGKLFYARPMESMQISALDGTEAEFLVYRPKMPHKVPSIYDHPSTYILEGFVCRQRYMPLWEGERSLQRTTHTLNKGKANEQELEWQARYYNGLVLSN